MNQIGRHLDGIVGVAFKTVVEEVLGGCLDSLATNSDRGDNNAQGGNFWVCGG